MVMMAILKINPHGDLVKCVLVQRVSRKHIQELLQIFKDDFKTSRAYVSESSADLFLQAVLVPQSLRHKQESSMQQES
jgi:hypothetical protein